LRQLRATGYALLTVGGSPRAPIAMRANHRPSSDSGPPNPAKLPRGGAAQRKVEGRVMPRHPATIPTGRDLHPAEVVQRRASSPASPARRPPHPATLVQPRKAPLGAPPQRPPHPATLAGNHSRGGSSWALQRAAAKDSKEAVVAEDDEDVTMYMLGQAGKKQLVDQDTWAAIQIPEMTFLKLKDLIDTYESQPADDVLDAKSTDAAQRKMGEAIGDIFKLFASNDELKLMGEQVKCPKGLKKPQASQFQERTFFQILEMITKAQICNHATGEAMLAIMSLFVKFA
jgi:hypothetical protein